jgi:ABC-type glycerol-3-phosphate transport system permease component
MALLLATGAGYGFWRFRFDRRNAIVGLLAWAALIAAIVGLYMLLN